jgi:hypothetical protein
MAVIIGIRHQEHTCGEQPSIKFTSVSSCSVYTLLPRHRRRPRYTRSHRRSLPRCHNRHNRPRR